MDYEKLHKDTIAKLHQMVNSGKITVETARSICADFVPESEDEKIRKDIISHLQYLGKYCQESMPNVNEWIAWLEKQGNNINCIYDKELSELLHIVIRRYINDPVIPYSERENVSKKILPYVELLEKQDEQKLDTDFSGLRTWKYIVDAVWTEKEGIGQYLDSPFTEEVAKKLQKRFGNIEPKPSWSEEDEKRISSILLSIEYCKEQYPDLREYQYDIDWLKSLRPQKQWKPSEEQIKVCKEVYADILSAKGFDLGTINSELNRLEEELKKLKE